MKERKEEKKKEQSTMTYIVKRKKKNKKKRRRQMFIHLMFSVKRSLRDDQRLSSRKNNGQGNKTRTNE